MYLTPKGRNWGDLVNWDDLGILYAVFIIVWTSILTSGIIWLFLNRRLPSIRIRHLPLAILSTFFLHVYLIKIFLAYTTNGHFLCSAEYWIMSIYLPFGIALFQAYLTQLRSVWEQQQNLVYETPDVSDLDQKKGMLQRWNQISRLRKSYCVIAAGMFVQLIMTSVLYAETPTLQGDWTSYGPIAHAKGQALCRKSLPWVTSAFWQLFWSWIYGPYTLFKIRNIHDIHRWRFQVIVSVIAGLPGTPLWLSALYLPQFKPVNMRFVPPMWLAPGIVVMQSVTVFIPIYEVWSSKRASKRTLSLLLKGNSTLDSFYTETTSATTPKQSSGISVVQSSPPANQDTRIFAMPSLRAALVLNPKPLLDFAAMKEFSAENILFLMRVKKFRSAWSTAAHTGQLTKSTVAQFFSSAIDIYAQLVNERTAEFPINIEGSIRKSLDTMFESVASQRYGPSLSNTFDFSSPFRVTTTRIKPVRAESSDSERTLWDNNVISMEPPKTEEPLQSQDGEISIPQGFGQDVFDEAEKSIEYLVLTNTWPKFVRVRSVP